MWVNITFLEKHSSAVSLQLHSLIEPCFAFLRLKNKKRPTCIRIKQTDGQIPQKFYRLIYESSSFVLTSSLFLLSHRAMCNSILPRKKIFVQIILRWNSHAINKFYSFFLVFFFVWSRRFSVRMISFRLFAWCENRKFRVFWLYKLKS